MIGKTNYSNWRALLFWIYSLEHVFLEILHILIIKLLNIINMLSIVIFPIPKDLSCVPKLWQIIVLQIAGGSEKIAPDRGLIVVAASIFLQIAKCISPYIAKCICHKIQGAQSQSHKKHKQTNKQNKRLRPGRWLIAWAAGSSIRVNLCNPGGSLSLVCRQCHPWLKGLFTIFLFLVRSHILSSIMGCGTADFGRRGL